jgi:hypothetical protein
LARFFGRIARLIDGYVVLAVIVTGLIWCCPSECWAWFSSYLSASMVVVLVNVVLLDKAFGDIESAGRSLILFILNVVQVILMYATWYELYKQPDALLKSVLTFATISSAEAAPRLAMLQRCCKLGRTS